MNLSHVSPINSGKLGSTFRTFSVAGWLNAIGIDLLKIVGIVKLSSKQQFSSLDTLRKKKKKSN